MSSRKRRLCILEQILTILLVLVLFAGTVPAADLTTTGRYEMRLAAIAGPESFSLTLWTVGAFAEKAKQAIVRSQPLPDEQKRMFDEFFATAETAGRLEWEIMSAINEGAAATDPHIVELERQLAELRAARARQAPIVEKTIESQVQTILQRENLARFQAGPVFIPPVFSKLVDLPHMLIVSYRDRIEMRTQVAIRRNITAQQIADLEDTIDRELGVVSLVVPIGGLGTYPTMIAATQPLQSVIAISTHEWCHVYLTLGPLGLAYGRSGEVTAMNETVCSIFGDDTAALVREEYYGEERKPRPWQATPTPTPAPTEKPKTEEPQGFNANRELAKIYKEAQERLQAKDVAGAEAVMEAGRKRLAENGFYLRKLNQAFFAFYGSYAEGPDSIRPDPLGEDLRELRRRSPTLRAFMTTVIAMTSYDDLKRALGK